MENLMKLGLVGFGLGAAKGFKNGLVGIGAGIGFLILFIVMIPIMTFAYLYEKVRREKEGDSNDK